MKLPKIPKRVEDAAKEFRDRRSNPRPISFGPSLEEEALVYLVDLGKALSKEDRESNDFKVGVGVGLFQAAKEARARLTSLRDMRVAADSDVGRASYPSDAEAALKGLADWLEQQGRNV